jgi:hypothetical protein
MVAREIVFMLGWKICAIVDQLLRSDVAALSWIAGIARGSERAEQNSFRKLRLSVKNAECESNFGRTSFFARHRRQFIDKRAS